MLAIKGTGLENLLQEDAVLEERHSITCKLCNAQFESLGGMQRHVVTEHFQKGDIPSRKEEGKQSYSLSPHPIFVTR